MVKKLEVLEELNNYVDDSESYADELVTIDNDNFNEGDYDELE